MRMITIIIFALLLTLVLCKGMLNCTSRRHAFGPQGVGSGRPKIRQLLLWWGSRSTLWPLAQQSSWRPEVFESFGSSPAFRRCGLHYRQQCRWGDARNMNSLKSMGLRAARASTNVFVARGERTAKGLLCLQPAWPCAGRWQQQQFPSVPRGVGRVARLVVDFEVSHYG